VDLVPIYTYWGNKQENVNGTSVLEVDSGIIPLGESGEITDIEYQILSRDHILIIGYMPWFRRDFTWEQRGIVPSVLSSDASDTSDAADVIEPPAPLLPPPANSIFLDGGRSNNDDASYAYVADGGDSKSDIWSVTFDGGNSGVVAMPPPPPSGVVIAAEPLGPPTPISGWTTVMADGFSDQHPLSELWGPNANDNDGNGITMLYTSPDATEVQVYAASQVNIDANGLRLTSEYARNVASGYDYKSGIVISQQYDATDSGQEGWRGITGFRWLPIDGVITVFEVLMAAPIVSGGGENPGFSLVSPSLDDKINMPEMWNYGTQPWGLGVTWIYDIAADAKNQATIYGLPAQSDASFHKWTMQFDGIAKNVRVWVDGVPYTELDIDWPASFSNTPMYLVLSHALRNAFGNSPTWTDGSTVFRFRSVAVYQDTANAGAGIVGGLIAPGTFVQ
jgi:hypothetical protein